VEGWNAKNPGIVIQPVGVNTEQYKIKIKSALAAGDAPDIFYLWGGSSLRPYILNNNILELDSYLDDNTGDKLIPGKLDACMLNGKVYSLPMFTYAANLYCNKSLFEKAGAKIPATYSELLQAVKLLRAARITPIVVGEKDRWPGMYWFDVMAMREAGSQACLDALTNPSLFDQPDFLTATQKFCDLINADAFNDDALSIGFEEMLDDFKAGKAAMIFQGNWVDVMSSAGNSVKGEIVEVPFPVIEGGKGSLSELLGGNVDGFCINTNVQHKKAAVDALKFICERAGKEGYLKGAGLPCWKMTGMDNSKAPALTKRSAVLMQSGNSFVEWWDTLLPAAGSEVHKALVAELFAGKKTPQEFIKEMTRMDGVTDVMIYNQY
jgi:raffinose/stachyose/melibiose transport system substrate-binding protein